MAEIRKFIVTPQQPKRFVQQGGDANIHNLVVTGTVSGITLLPDQTGHSGEYLTTNGTVASWGAIDLSGYVPYTGATGDVNLGINGITVNDATIGTLTGLIKGTTGVLSAATADTDYQLPYWSRDAVSGYVYPKTLTDKVGIGTTTPGKSLSIKTSATDNAEVRLFSSTAGGHIDTIAGSVAGNLYLQPSTGITVLYTSGVDSYLRLTKGDGVFTGILHSNGNSYLGGGSLKVGKSLSNTAVKTMDIAGNLNYDQVADVSKAQHEGMVLTEGTGGTLAAGEWFYNVNFYTAEGENSTYNSGYSTVKITVSANATVTISNIPVSTDPRVVGRKLYRSSMSDSAGNRPYFQYLFATIADNTTTSYVDTGTAVNTNDYGYWKANTTAGVAYIDGVKMYSASGYNTSFGVGVLQSLTRGNGNAGFGSYSLRYVSTGVNNTAFGHYAVYDNTTGNGNIGIGYSTVAGNSTGSSNVAVGQNALRNNSGYSYTANTAVGDFALGILNASNNYNTAIGYYAGLRNQGSYNTFVGGYAGNLAVAAATGNYNLVLGYEAGRSMGTGADKNILIGYQTELPTATADSQLNIGNVIYATTMGVGNTPTAAGKVGIGKVDPAEKLDVFGSLRLSDISNTLNRGIVFHTNAGTLVGSITRNDAIVTTADLAISSYAGIGFKANNGAALPDAYSMYLTSAGNLGIGTTAATAMLHLPAGTTAASTAPLKFTSGTNMSTAETGAVEYDGTSLYFTRTGTTRETIGTIVTKTDTGDPTGAEGLFCINTFDNTFKVYADGAWRTLASGW